MVETSKLKGLQRPLKPQAAWGEALFPFLQSWHTGLPKEKKKTGYVTETNKLIYIAN